VEMKRRTDNDRVIACRYHPTEVGEYQVLVLWSGQNVPGSPFHVSIVDTVQQLEHLRGSSIMPPFHNESLRMSTLSENGLMFNEDF